MKKQMAAEKSKSAKAPKTTRKSEPKKGWLSRNTVKENPKKRKSEIETNDTSLKTSKNSKKKQTLSSKQYQVVGNSEVQELLNSLSKEITNCNSRI